MKNVFRLFLFLMAFQIEVRVRASGDLLQSPEGCLKAKDFCSIQATHENFHYKTSGVQLHMGAGSVAQRSSENTWKLINGYVWIQQGSKLTLETLYASMSAPQGEYWVIDKGDRVIIRNVNADLTVEFRDGKKLQVPEGFEFWVGGLNTLGKSEHGMIEPVNFKDHLKLWSGLFQGSKEDFVSAVQKQKNQWGDLVEKSAEIYRASADRQIASVQEAERQKAEKARRQEAQHQKVRQLFFERTFYR